MATPVGIIKQFVKALIETKSTGTDAVNAAFKDVGAVSYDVFTSKFTADQNGLSTQDFLEQKCGIRVNNTDTGAITGSDAGYSKTAKTAESIVPETAAAVELTSKQYSSFTKNGLTVNVTYLEKSDTDAGENFDYSGDTYLEKQRLVTRALYNWWIPESLDLINQSLGINFTDGRASINEINVVFEEPNYNDGNVFILDRPTYEQATKLEFTYDMGLASSATLYINTDLIYTITANDKDGTLDDDKYIRSDFYGAFNHSYNGDGYNNRTPQFSNYLDRIILQSLAEVAIKSNVSYAYYLPKEITAGLCEIVGGFDSSNGYNFQHGYSSGLSAYVYRASYGGDMGAPTYGYALMRYLAKNYSDDTPDETPPVFIVNKTAKESLTGTISDDTIINYAKNVTMSGGDGGDLLTTMRKTSGVKVYGDAGDDTLEAYNATKVTLSGGTGNDEIFASSSQLTIIGGTGNDTIELDSTAAQIQYKSGDGNDVIDGFNETATLKIGNGTTDTYSTVKSGSDIIVTVGDGKITLSGAANLSTVNILGKLFGNAIILDDKATSPQTLDTIVEIADASKRTKAIKITGNALDNSIVGGSKNDSLYGGDGDDYLDGGKGNDKISGGSGNDYLYGGAGNDSLSGGNGADTLSGGSGNDTLTGGNGNDLFIYTAGNDLITDMTASDTLQIGDGTDTYSKKTSGSNIILTIGDGLITLKGAAKLSAVNILGEEVLPTANYDDDSAANVTFASGIEIGDATERTKAIKITGNALDNSILGGSGKDSLYGKDGDDYLVGNAGNDKLYGQNGNDTLWGGKGNDTLTGGNGADTFIYNSGEGKDVISDFGDDDLLQITGTWSATVNDKSIAFKVGSTASAITLKNFTATTFNINGDSYKISGSKLVK